MKSPILCMVSMLALCAASQVHAQPGETILSLDGFEESVAPANGTSNASAKIVSGTGVTAGKKALQIDFEPVQTAQFAIGPSDHWNWSQYGDVNLAFDVTNPGDRSLQVFFTVQDAHGRGQTRMLVVPAGKTVSYFAPINGRIVTDETGMRDTPKAWRTDEEKAPYRNGERRLDMAQIKRIVFKTEEQFDKRSLIVDNVRLRHNPQIDPDYLVGIVDRFGQAAQLDYPYKIHSEAELKAKADAERAQLDASAGAPGRSKWGGWANGPKLEATGFFRTAKYSGKWWLVDPDGYLFFSSGIANVRMANLGTITGYDFTDPSVRHEDPERLTPEDSIGIEPVSEDARRTRFLSSVTRGQMFQWLPAYDDPLGDHYGYRRSAHTGAVEHGEIYSFYRANLERRYGDDYMETWRDVTIDRMKDWGMTSFGNWIDPSFYHKDRIPYFANGWIIGNYKVLYSGQDYWSPLPDFYDPEFARRARLTIEQIGREVAGSPWCIGVFVDNEKGWGNMQSDRSRFGAVFYAFGKDAADQPAKAAFTRLLRNRYPDIGSLNAAWGTSFASWDAFAAPFAMDDNLSDAARADFSMLYSDYAETYFRIVRDELKRVLPNHMYMGVRIAANWGMPIEVVNAAKKYSDVMSFNNYREGMHPDTWGILKSLDRPTIIGEYHIGSTSDTGLYNPGLIVAADQADRAQMYQRYMKTVIDNPYMVGAHWFQYIDDNVTGRAYDGENYNVGWVTNTDIPYPEMVEAAKALNYDLYEKRMAAPERAE